MKKIIALMALIIILASAGDALAQKKIHNKMYLGGEAGISLPMGDFGDAANMGFGLNAYFNYYFMSALAANVQLGYWTWGLDDQGYDVDGSFTDIPLIFGIFYEVDAGQFLILFGADLGIHFTSVSIEAYGQDTDDSDTEFGFSPYAGILIPVSRQMDFRGVLKFNIIEDANHFNIQAGLRFRLP